MQPQTFLINQRGSVDDIRKSLKIGSPSKPDLLKALANEMENKNRDTVVKMLLGSLKKQSSKI